MDDLAKRGAMGIFVKHMGTRTSLPVAKVEARARKRIPVEQMLFPTLTGTKNSPRK
jgi:hypothetical protein